MSKNATSKKLTTSILVLIALSLALCFTTFALVWAKVSVENNLFQTGQVKINLNDGKAVVSEQDFIFAPGMTVQKEFFIENQSTTDVYYKVYFTDIGGGLADVVDVTVMEGERVFYQGKVSAFTETAVGAADEPLKLGERRTLSVYFTFPETAGNDMQNLNLTFTLKADAVQAKNNPDKLFH